MIAEALGWSVTRCAALLALRADGHTRAKNCSPNFEPFEHGAGERDPRGRSEQHDVVLLLRHGAFGL
jgi:hypothetical protein